MLDVHLTAPFRILRAASEFIRETAKREISEGKFVARKVVNISSISGLYGGAGQANYGAAKSALVGLTRSMCKEWGRYNVNVNCVAFGLIETRLTQSWAEDDAKIDINGQQIQVGIQPEAIKTLNSMIPMGRAGTPEEAAGAVCLFCYPESDYVSGQVLVAGGGLLV
jgi:3-oxoacyl-[acyl-carrier protein] reductase